VASETRGLRFGRLKEIGLFWRARRPVGQGGREMKAAASEARTLWLSNRAPWVKFFFAKPTCAIAPAPAWRDRSRRNAERSRVAGVPRGSEFGMAVQATPTMRYRSSGKIATPSLLLSGGTATDVRPPFRRGHQSGRVPGSGLSARSAGSRRMMGMRGGSLPMCTSRSANSRNQSLGMAAPTSRQGRLDASDGRRRNNRGSAHGGTSGVAGRSRL
jgi:hypothetical protein